MNGCLRDCSINFHILVEDGNLFLSCTKTQFDIGTLQIFDSDLHVF